MPLSGAASGRPLMINSVACRGYRQILLATFSRLNAAFPQLMSPFQATRRRNLSLAGDRDDPRPVSQVIPGQPQTVERALDVNCEAQVELVLGDLAGRLGDRHRRVVHQDVP